MHWILACEMRTHSLKVGDRVFSEDNRFSKTVMLFSYMHSIFLRADKKIVRLYPKTLKTLSAEDVATEFSLCCSTNSPQP